MRRRSAFTLVEMMTVISIIGCLSAMLFPALLSAERAIDRTLCASNLRHIGEALHIYADDHAGYMPDTGASSIIGGPRPDDGRHFDDLWDRPGTDSYPDVQTTGNQGNLWLLVRQEYADASSFICPATADEPSLNSPRNATITGFYSIEGPTGQPTAAEREFLEKFRAGRCSYSYQNQFVHPGFDEAVSPRCNNTTHIALHSPELAILADRNPYTRVHRTLMRIVSPTESPEANSPNHGGEGQNVLYLSGKVRWHETPYAGAWRQEVDRHDNIYRPDKGDPTDLQNVPRHVLDSYLVP